MLRHDAPETILVLHGPNLNLFGRREPHIYGTMTLEQINERLRTLAAKVQVKLVPVNPNHGGVLATPLKSTWTKPPARSSTPPALRSTACRCTTASRRCPSR